MAFGISLWLDQVSAAHVEAWWQVLADAGLSSSMPEMNYRPHITLGIYDSLDPASVIRELERFVADRAPPTVLLSGLGVFPGNPSVLWAVPAADATLLEMHRDLQGTLRPASRDLYGPGRWVPHCTLATDLTGAELGPALEVLSVDSRPIEARLETLDLVRFPPVEVLWRSRFLK